ncbi:hypothetical protein NBRC10513v2_001286 [Rhodotorula toruloides]
MATPDKPLFPEESTGDWTVDMYRSLLNGKNPRKSFAILAMVHDLGPLTKAEVQEVHDKLKLLRDRARAKYPDWATREQTFQPNVLPEDEPLLSDSDFTDDESSMDESSDESALSRREVEPHEEYRAPRIFPSTPFPSSPTANVKTPDFGS